MEEKLKLLQEMATTEGDIRNDNIGSFSQGVVVGERNASRLALEVIESIKRGDKEPYIPSPIMTNIESGLKELNVDFFSKIYDNGDYGNIKKIEIPKSFSWKPITRFSIG
jgi:hypothetical protein